MNEAHLRIAAAYLLRPTLDGAFTMGAFSAEPALHVLPCESAVCVIGHGPSMGFPRERGEGWEEYSERIFDIPQGSAVWDYLFAGRWECVDNTARGAAMRIQYYLAHGLPATWQEEMLGTAPLSYMEEEAKR